MKEWVKPLYIGYHQALDLPKNLFPFPRTGHLKISLGPTQFLYSKYHGLLKLIFHTISTMVLNSSGGLSRDSRHCHKNPNLKDDETESSD